VRLQTFATVIPYQEVKGRDRELSNDLSDGRRASSFRAVHGPRLSWMPAAPRGVGAPSEAGPPRRIVRSLLCVPALATPARSARWCRQSVLAPALHGWGGRDARLGARRRIWLGRGSGGVAAQAPGSLTIAGL